MKREIGFGDKVQVRWGLDFVPGIVREVYGLPGRRHVVVAIHFTGGDHQDPPTISVPIEDVELVEPATAS